MSIFQKTVERAKLKVEPASAAPVVFDATPESAAREAARIQKHTELKVFMHEKLLGISKRGNKYLRKLLIHGARSAMPSLLATPTPLGAWLRALLTRVHKNAATVALANKLARIAWAVLRRGVPFTPVQLTAA